MTAALYTASDFQKLASGVDPGFVGEATVQVWAPSQDEWRLPLRMERSRSFRQGKSGDPIPAGRR